MLGCCGNTKKALPQHCGNELLLQYYSNTLRHYRLPKKRNLPTATHSPWGWALNLERRERRAQGTNLEVGRTRSQQADEQDWSMGVGGRESVGFFGVSLLTGWSCVDARRKHAVSAQQREATRHLVVVGHCLVLPHGTLVKLIKSERAGRTWILFAIWRWAR